MSDAFVAIIAAECKDAVAAANSLEDKARAAMKVAKGSWLTLDQDVQFRGAVGALLIHYGLASPEYERIAAELSSLRKLSAILQAAEVGLSVNLTDADLPKHEPIGLLRMWQEILSRKEKA